MQLDVRNLASASHRVILRGANLSVITAIYLIILAVVGLFMWKSETDVTQLAPLGYPAVFLSMVISGASTFFPVPGQALVLASGALWNPVLVGVVAGLGNSTGELAGYAVGRAGGQALESSTRLRWWTNLQVWFGRYGFFAIFTLALIPNPIFDALGLLAGSLRYPWLRFWLACMLGNCIKYVGMAYLGNVVRWWLW